VPCMGIADRIVMPGRYTLVCRSPLNAIIVQPRHGKPPLYPWRNVGNGDANDENVERAGNYLQMHPLTSAGELKLNECVVGSNMKSDGFAIGNASEPHHVTTLSNDSACAADNRWACKHIELPILKVSATVSQMAGPKLSGYPAGARPTLAIIQNRRDLAASQSKGPPLSSEVESYCHSSGVEARGAQGDLCEDLRITCAGTNRNARVGRRQSSREFEIESRGSIEDLADQPMCVGRSERSHFTKAESSSPQGFLQSRNAAF